MRYIMTYYCSIKTMKLIKFIEKLKIEIEKNKI